jgi:hypothetical protein
MTGRLLLGIGAVVALGLGGAACSSGKDTSHGRSGPTGRSMTVGTSSFSARGKDRDNDADHNDDDAQFFNYGHAANAPDRQASIALVRHYFAAAAAADGARACRLLVPFVAEAVVENEGKSPRLRGRTCSVVMSKLFGFHRRLLAAKNATLKVLAVRVQGDKALVVLDFPSIAEVRQIGERRVGNAWKLQDLLDGILE